MKTPSEPDGMYDADTMEDAAATRSAGLELNDELYTPPNSPAKLLNVIIVGLENVQNRVHTLLQFVLLKAGKVLDGKLGRCQWPNKLYASADTEIHLPDR